MTVCFRSAEQVSLRLERAGLTAEWRDGLLRDIAVDGHRVLSAAGFLVRTATWDTVPADVAVDDARDQIRFMLQYDDMSCRAHATLTIRPLAEVLEMVVSAELLAPASLNRIGLVALLPMPELAGVACRVEHSNGCFSSGVLPERITLPPNFKDIRSIEYHHPGGPRVRCAFSGESFEMEDQRLFSDASLKIYSRSNALPRPVRFEAGERIDQQLFIGWSGKTEPRRPAADIVSLVIGDRTGQCVPQVGIAGNLAGWDRGRRPELTALHPQFIHLEISPDTLDLALSRMSEGEEGGYSVVIDGDEPDFLDRVADGLRGLPVLRVALSTSRLSAWDAARTYLGDDLGVHAQALVALLRSCPRNASFGGFGTAAIIHDADNFAVMDTTRSLPAMLAAAREVTGGPVHIGPSAIGLFHHPHSPSPLENPNGRRMPMVGRDPRNIEPYAAAWAVDFMSCAVDAASVTLFAESGLQEIETDISAAIFREIAATSRLSLLGVRSNDGDRRVAAFAVIVLLANRTPNYVRVAVDGGYDWRFRSLANAPLAKAEAIDLAPYMTVVGEAA
jgi:hypothetical protein